MLAAGNYRLTYNSTAHILSIRGLDQNSGRVFTTAVASAAADGPGKLVFNCYNKSCYLAEIWQGAAAGSRGLQVPQGEQERRIAFLRRAVSMTVATK